MKLPRRHFLHLAAGAAALPRFAWAQVYPTRPVRIIVGYVAGGGTDIDGLITMTTGWLAMPATGAMSWIKLKVILS